MNAVFASHLYFVKWKILFRFLSVNENGLMLVFRKSRVMYHKLESRGFSVYDMVLLIMVTMLYIFRTYFG